MLYQIGDFSKKANVSIRTLRYYDSIDLFKPVEVDLFTNYRYYSTDQLEDLKLINDLKYCGFSLEEIKENWNSFTNDLMLERKKKLLEDIKNKEEQIRKVEYLRSNIESGKIYYKNKNKTKREKEKNLFK